ncbi:MAG: hypothetical protein MR227_03110 [Firmicutes bacterium]|nr:hypothetical protein [Bacillota bacterium]
MDKRKSIVDYYNANQAYFDYLQGILGNSAGNCKNIFNDGNIYGAEVGCMSNILLAIKEDIVLKKETYESNLFGNLLEQSVELIASKVPNGYMIDNYVFNSAAELVSKLRNKLAHGDFTLDLNHNRIMLNIDDENEVKVRINKLSTFIVNALSRYLKDRERNKNKRDLIIIDRNISHRQNPIVNDKELRNVIKDFYCIEFVLTRSDSKNIELSVLNDFEEAFNKYKKDKKLIHMSQFKNNLDSNYEFKINRMSIENDQDIDKLVYYIKEKCPDNLNYEAQLLFIGEEIKPYLNKDYEKMNPLYSNLLNLLILSELEKTNSFNVLKQRLIETYERPLIIDYNNLASVCIAMFNALFSYSLDDYYKDSLEFDNFQNNGFDYSLLDLSLINPSIVTIDEVKISEVENSCNSISNVIKKIEDKITENLKSLKIVKEKGNSKAETTINNNLQKLEEKKNELKNKLSEKKKHLSNLKSYYLNNINHIKNRAIIEGIRNAIAHGNYKIDLNFGDYILIFTDLYDGKVTFEAKIPLLDFIKTVESNTSVIEKYIKTDSKSI